MQTKLQSRISTILSIYIFKSYRVNSITSEKLLHNFKYFTLTILLWGFFYLLKAQLFLKLTTTMSCLLFPYTKLWDFLFTPSFYSFILLSFAALLIVLLIYTPIS